MMPLDGEQCYEESFNSFLAGAFLINRRIKNLDLLNMLNNFEKTYNVDVVSLGGDIILPIYMDDNEVILRGNIDDIIYGKNTNVRDYLYSFTTPRVREFFGIPEIKYENKKINILIKRLFKNNNARKKVVTKK